MQSQRSLHWLNMPEQSLFTIKIHGAVTSGPAIDFYLFIGEGECAAELLDLPLLLAEDLDLSQTW